MPENDGDENEAHGNRHVSQIGERIEIGPHPHATQAIDANSDIANYERFQNPDSLQSQLTVQQFMNDEDNVILPLGAAVREEQRTQRPVRLPAAC